MALMIPCEPCRKSKRGCSNASTASSDGCKSCKRKGIVCITDPSPRPLGRPLEEKQQRKVKPKRSLDRPFSVDISLSQGDGIRIQLQLTAGTCHCPLCAKAHKTEQAPEHLRRHLRLCVKGKSDTDLRESVKAYPILEYGEICECSALLNDPSPRQWCQCVQLTADLSGCP